MVHLLHNTHQRSVIMLITLSKLLGAFSVAEGSNVHGSSQDV